jgi:hypothetical protein
MPCDSHSFREKAMSQEQRDAFVQGWRECLDALAGHESYLSAKKRAEARYPAEDDNAKPAGCLCDDYDPSRRWHINGDCPVHGYRNPAPPEAARRWRCTKCNCIVIDEWPEIKMHMDEKGEMCGPLKEE